MRLTLSKRYLDLQSQIAMHAKNAARDPASIQLIAVTKYSSMEQMLEAYELGIRHFGESRLQESLPKIELLPSDIKWHFIGSLQTNKLGKIIERFDYIHSVDSLEMARAIAKKSRELKRNPSLFLQVNTSGELSKKGFSEQELLQNIETISDLKLNIIGLMTMAPPTGANEAKICFERLKQLQNSITPAVIPHLSMGMSQDFPIAIAEGATYLRIGSSLFQ